MENQGGYLHFKETEKLTKCVLPFNTLNSTGPI